MKRITFLLLIITSVNCIYAQNEDGNKFSSDEIKNYLKKVDSINKTFSYQHGEIQLKNGLATLVVPKGMKFLDATQSHRVLEDLWGNPPEETLGMLFNEDENPMSLNLTYAVDIQYESDGYVSDKEANDINYGKMLREMQKSLKNSNPERIKQGYPTIELIGWAEPPYYDSNTKKLYWAKEMKFDNDSINTLNYNIRILGRKGYLMLNAIGEMDVLNKFDKNKDEIIASVEFNDGNKYSDFNSNTDKIAAYGIGGLIAGKVLAKAGFFAVILKFGKFILLGIAAFFGKFKRLIFGGKEKEQTVKKIERDTTQDI